MEEEANQTFNFLIVSVEFKFSFGWSESDSLRQWVMIISEGYMFVHLQYLQILWKPFSSTSLLLKICEGELLGGNN